MTNEVQDMIALQPEYVSLQEILYSLELFTDPYLGEGVSIKENACALRNQIEQELDHMMTPESVMYQDCLQVLQDEESGTV